MPKHYENARDRGGNRPYDYDEKRGYKRAFAEDKEIDLYEAWKQAKILQPKLTFQQIVGFLKPLLEAKALGDLGKSQTTMVKKFTNAVTHPHFNKSPKSKAAAALLEKAHQQGLLARVAAAALACPLDARFAIQQTRSGTTLSPPWRARTRLRG